MKKFKKLFTLFVLLFVLGMILPNSVPIVGTVENVSAAVKITQKSLVLIKGQSKTLKITGTKNKPKWSSSNRSVATVSQNGKVVAKKKGSATITAKIGKKSYKCSVIIETPKISQTSLDGYVGNSYKIAMHDTKQKVAWRTSNSSVATVDKNGLIRFKKTGNCKITGKIASKIYTCNVTVKRKNNNIPLNSITLSSHFIEVKLNETKYLSVALTPQNVTNKIIEWKTRDSSIATVNNGNVTGVSIGRTIVSATSSGKTAYCEVVVTSDYSETDARNSLSSTSHTLKNSVIVVVKNNYKYAISVSPVCNYYDLHGNLIRPYGGNIYQKILPGKEAVFDVSKPQYSSGEYIDYSTFVVTYNIIDYESNPVIPDIMCSTSYDKDTYTISVRNTGLTLIDNCSIGCVFYKNGQVVGCNTFYFNNISPNTSLVDKARYPVEMIIDKIIPDSTRFYVN